MTAPAPPRLLEQRRAGVLLHPTSLRGAAGDPLAERGGLGAAGRDFIDWLATGGFSIWQVLPLGAPGASGSPYWARSDMAGEPSMIDAAELPDAVAQSDDYQRFCAESADWLEGYVLFDALAEHFRAPWWDWPTPYRSRDAAALAEFTRTEAAALEQRRLVQWHFDWQWRALRRHAASRGVFLFGDLPIYVSPDSVATWAHIPSSFSSRPRGGRRCWPACRPTTFPPTGSCGANPLYDWTKPPADGFAFWRTRFAHQLRTFSTWCASITSAASSRTGPFRPMRAPRARASGVPPPGHALFEALAAEHPRAAGGRRGPRPHHRGCARAAARLRPAGHARAAVRLRRFARQSASAPQLQPRRCGLHWHP